MKSFFFCPFAILYQFFPVIFTWHSPAVTPFGGCDIVFCPCNVIRYLSSKIFSKWNIVSNILRCFFASGICPSIKTAYWTF